MLSKRTGGRRAKASQRDGRTRRRSARRGLQQTKWEAAGWRCGTQTATPTRSDSKSRGVSRAVTRLSSGAGTGHRRKWSWETCGMDWNRTQEYSREPQKPETWDSHNARQHCGASAGKLYPAMGGQTTLGDEESAFFGLTAESNHWESMPHPGRRKVGSGPKDIETGTPLFERNAARSVTRSSVSRGMLWLRSDESGLQRPSSVRLQTLPECSGRARRNPTSPSVGAPSQP